MILDNVAKADGSENWILGTIMAVLGASIEYSCAPHRTAAPSVLEPRPLIVALPPRPLIVALPPRPLIVALPP